MASFDVHPPGSAVLPGVDVDAARSLARDLLSELPGRWRHSAGVAARAAELSGAVDPADRDLLVAAAWLHDVGYSSRLVGTGFHQLDGADFLLREGWSARLCALVAHHSGAHLTSRYAGLHGPLSQYPREASRVSDALAYADQTVSVEGDPMRLEERLLDKLARHGPDSAYAAAHDRLAPYLRACAQRVDRRLGAAPAPA